MDFSTLNLDRLKKLPRYSLPPTYQLQQGSGNGCSGDPPGYPTYFTRSVYTRHGNHPRNGPYMVIVFEGVNYVIPTQEEKLVRNLWLPLSLDHPRTRLWISGTYRHHNHCYGDVIYPVPYW